MSFGLKARLPPKRLHNVFKLLVLYCYKEVQKAYLEKTVVFKRLDLNFKL